MANSCAEPTNVFEDRQQPGQWCVAWFDADGRRVETIFSGPKARERAVAYAMQNVGCEMPILSPAEP